MNYQGNQDSTSTFSIEKYPETCSVDGCEEQTAVAMLRIVQNGKLRVVQPSAALDYPSQSGKWQATPKAGIDVRGWITRCARCYSEDMARFEARREARRIGA